MPSIKSATQRCMKLFASICARSHTAPAKYSEQMTPSMLEDEYDRFKMWSGNLGALQKGHASLDWRLCDAEVMSTSILDILTILEKDLSGSLEVLTSERLPYEEQASDFDSDSDDTASDISQVQPPELVLRSQNINDTIKTLYKLSFSIRRPGVKVAPEKALLYREMIQDTTYEFGEIFNPLDRLHVIGLLNDLRKEVLIKSLGRAVAHGDPELPEASECPLTNRLAEAVTKRRRKFRYWSRHKQKLAKITSDEDDESRDGLPIAGQDDQSGKNRATEEQNKIPRAPSQSLGPQTETTATKYIPAPTGQDDSVSVAPSASTARDLEGHEAMLPRPPETDGEDFECPYCFILCPAKEVTGSRWRKHMLEDLQPYLCTYADCKLPEQLFGSRTAWVLHEDAFHRQLWKCRDHHNIAFTTAEAYRSHLEREHQELEPDHLQAVIESSATVREDDRDLCPLCLIPVSRLGKGQNLIKHIAHHLERISCFALPRNMELGREVGDDDSLRLASDQSDDSRRLSDLEFVRSDQSDDRQDATDYYVDPAGSRDASQDPDEDPLTTELFRSCSEGQILRVLHLLEKGASPNCVSSNGSPLYAASSNGHVNIVRLLLERGAKPDSDTPSADALLEASLNGFANVVQLLLEHGADPNRQTRSENLALQAASSRGHEDVVQLLLQAGAYVDKQGGFHGTALMAASAGGYVGVVRLLLDSGADVNAQGGKYGSCLKAATMCGHGPLLQPLLYGGAEPLTSDQVDRMIEDAWQDYEEHESNEYLKNSRSNPICNLARGLRYEGSEGSTEKAEGFLQRALDFESEKNEEIDLCVLDIIEVLALVYEDQEKWEEAEAMCTRGVKESTSRFGASNPETLRRMRTLAYCLMNQGRYRDAVKMHRELLRTREKILGQEAKDTLQSAHDLAVSLRGLAGHAEAEGLLRRAMEGRQKNLGPEAFGTLESTGELAGVIEALGRPEEAVPLYERAGNGFEKTQGPEYHWTKYCREAVGRLRQPT